MLDSVDKAIQSREERLKKQSDSLDMFFKEYDDDLSELNQMIGKLKNVVESYNGYDFTQEFKDLVVTELGGYE